MNHPTADFAPFAARMRAEGLPDIVIDNFEYYYTTLAAGDTGFIGEDQIELVPAVPTMEDLAHHEAAGRKALRHTAVLKLNGGLGTSMGLDKAKSLLVAKDGLSFLDIIAKQNLAAREHHGFDIPLIFLNSFNTDADTAAVLEHYPALGGTIPQRLMQNKVPKIRQDTLAPAEWSANPNQEWCPPGHGEVYIALATSGMLDTLLENGYSYLFISNADNLGATLDLSILGYIASNNVPFLMEVARRTEADKKGGHLARRHDGQLILREVAQCPDEDLAAFQDVDRYRYFNTNTLWVNLHALRDVLQANNGVMKLPMIRNAKTVDPKNSSSPAVYQLETAMGAAIAVFPGAQAVHVPRSRFVPVKTCSDLLGLRSDIYVLDEHFHLHTSPERTLPPITIDLDSKVYKVIEAFEQRFPEGVPSLLHCGRLKVTGDVQFAPGSVFVGNVQIINQHPDQRHLPATTLTNTTYTCT